jgi:hypothetical protein
MPCALAVVAYSDATADAGVLFERGMNVSGPEC